MKKRVTKQSASSKEVQKLREQLSEAQETLRAIQSGEVDALLVSDDRGERIFTLKNADQPYRIMVENMNEGAATLRKDGFVFYCNQRFAQLLKTPSERIIGSSIYNYLPEIEAPRLKALMETDIKNGATKACTLKASDKTEVPVQLSFSPVEIENDPGMCVIATDLTERKLAEDKLRESYSTLESRVKDRTLELAKAVKVRDEFLSIASHELKTPLTSLKLQAQIRKRRVSRGEMSFFDSAKITQMVNDDEKQINRLTRLVDDMLDLSRLNTGKLSLNFEDTDLCEVIKEVNDRIGPQAQALGARVIFAPTEPVVGFWDRYRIEQIFTNLLTNALKYGSSKPVEVKIKKRGDHAILAVKDQGIGIARADQDRIFGQFERAVPVAEVSGLGLGLYIVKQLVEAHMGKIWVESVQGKGSTFFVEIPLR